MIETIKAIAMLCSVIAGDKPSMVFTTSLVVKEQVACHAYYADCIQRDSLLKCMRDRPKVIEAKIKKEHDEYMKASK